MKPDKDLTSFQPVIDEEFHQSIISLKRKRIVTSKTKGRYIKLYEFIFCVNIIQIECMGKNGSECCLQRPFTEGIQTRSLRFIKQALIQLVTD